MNKKSVNCAIFKPIARKLPKLEPNEIFAEAISYDTKYDIVKLSYFSLLKDN